ncbi:recombinase family protein [Bittarella massiliensis]|nr:recombinase family protein [Bittarella massiliensis (ex Durand et al. 2017)]
MPTQYCKGNGFAVEKIYCDDGWSGTNFERPQFKQMIEDTEDGKINLVVVKHLFQFYREYAQMGLILSTTLEKKRCALSPWVEASTPWTAQTPSPCPSPTPPSVHH